MLHRREHVAGLERVVVETDSRRKIPGGTVEAAVEDGMGHAGSVECGTLQASNSRTCNL